MADWNPESYARFGDLRLRPALDLLGRVGALPDGAVVDLGCGSGAVGPALRARFSKAPVFGVDASPAMLEKARVAGGYDHLTKADLSAWQPEAAVALIFSNAALHWAPSHDQLLPRLAGFLAPGGTLAVQMPRQSGAPSHRFLREFAADMFPDRFDAATGQSPVFSPVEYHRLLAPFGHVSVWETDYVQRLEPSADGHPVRRFTEATAMRPFVAKLDASETRSFAARYDAALAAAYPVEPDGAVLFPFRRLFMTLSVTQKG
ncbi:MAG: methyltransferase domain-containing protein [Albidovulum sp.]